MPGRPRFLDDEKRRQVCALISAGCNVHIAAHYVGCNSITIRREAHAPRIRPANAQCPDQ